MPLTDAGNISGSNTDTLNIANIQNAAAAAYACTVSNLIGSTTSNPASLIIPGAPPPESDDLFVLYDDQGNPTFVVNSDGDISMTGNLYGQTTHREITLDPAKRYFTVSDASGRIVLAIDCNAGDLHTVDSITPQTPAPIDSTGAIWDLQNAGDTVLALFPDGLIEILGDFMPFFPYMFPIPAEDIEAMPTAAGNPETCDWETIYGAGPSRQVPQPMAQGRLFYEAFDYGYSDDPIYDVSDLQWRLKYNKNHTTWRDYMLLPGFRYYDEDMNTIINLFGSIEFLPQEADAWIVRNPGPPYDIVVDINVEEGDAGDVDHTTQGWPDVGLPGKYPMNITFLDTLNKLHPLSDPLSPPHESDDNNTSAFTRLYLYSMTFLHPPKIPRRQAIDHLGATYAMDYAVPLACRLDPPTTPGIDKITITIWDPADPTLKCYFEGVTGAAACLGLWDGKLYIYGDPVNYPTPYYTTASDVFMSATVEWTDDDDDRPWYVEEDEFQEDRVAIDLYDYNTGYQVSNDPDNFAYITSAPEMPDLRATLLFNGGYDLTDSENWWELSLEYSRGDQSQTFTIPGGGVLTTGYQIWDIKSELDNLLGEIMGGKGILKCTLDNGLQLEHEFHIRGTNPSDTSAINYINANDAFRQVQDVHWYGVPIAIHESKMPMNGSQTLWGYLCQFNIINTSSSSATRLLGRDFGAHLRALPNMHPDATTYGWGIMMLTLMTAEREPVSERWFQHEALWDWKENILAGMRHLNEKRTISQFTLHPTDNNLPLSITIRPGHVFTASGVNGQYSYHDLDTIKRFNGGNYFYYDGEEWDLSSIAKGILLETPSGSRHYVYQVQTPLDENDYVYRVFKDYDEYDPDDE